jgi:hypothetical protein
MEWQPIETAPNNGQIILVCGKNLKNEYFVCDAEVRNGAAYAFDFENDDYWYRIDATHWMPLPPPPQ